MALARSPRRYAKQKLPVSRLLEARVAAPLMALAILVVLVLVPIGFMFVVSIRPGDGGLFTLDPYIRAFTSPGFARIMTHTLILAGGSALIALPVAFGFAFLTERTDMPLRHAMYTLMFIPMSTPVFATTLGWVLLLGPRAGTLNQYLRLLTRSDAANGPFNIFSLEGMIFVQALTMVPTMWLFLISVLRNMDPALEDASAASGANRWQTVTRISAPLVRPGAAAVLIYFFITGLESLELPLALGPTAGIEVLSTKIFFTLNPAANQGLDYAVPAVFGVIALVTGLGAIGLYLYLIRSPFRYAVVTGKGYRPKLISLGRWKHLALGAIGLYMLADVVIPLAMMAYTSLLRFYVPPVAESAVYFKWTLANYASILSYRFYGQYFVNTIIVVVGAATLTMLLVSFIAWAVVRFPSRLSQLVNFLSLVPLAVPGIISTTALFLMFIGTPLYGTLPLLTLAFTARFLAFGTRLMHAAQIQIHRELEEASLASGAGMIRTFFRINLRLLAPAFVNGWLWVLVHSAKDFSVALLLASAGTNLLANRIFGSFGGGSYTRASALMICLIAFNVVLVMAGRRWISRSARNT